MPGVQDVAIGPSFDLDLVLEGGEDLVAGERDLVAQSCGLGAARAAPAALASAFASPVDELKGRARARRGPSGRACRPSLGDPAPAPSLATMAAVVPPPTHIQGLDPRFFRPCIFPVLRRLGYGTAVTVNNGVSDGPQATDMVLSFSAFDEGGRLLGTLPDLGRLAPGEIVKLDTRPLCDELDAPPDQNALGIVHVVPARARWTGGGRGRDAGAHGARALLG